MKNDILELFKAYERETEFEGQAIPESMYDALANDIVKLFQISKLNRIGIIGHGVEGIICGIDEARSIFISQDHVLRFPELPSDRPVLDAFQELNLQTTITAESIRELSEQLQEYKSKNDQKNKPKGHERPYKYHR